MRFVLSLLSVLLAFVVGVLVEREFHLVAKLNKQESPCCKTECPCGGKYPCCPACVGNPQHKPDTQCDCEDCPCCKKCPGHQ